VELDRVRYQRGALAMSLRGAFKALAKRVGLVVGATERCPSCAQLAPAGTLEAPADGPESDGRGVPHCTRCRLPLASAGLLVTRWARGYSVHAKVVDLR
jgi:hypothetical protein